MNARAILDPEAIGRLCKICGLFGSHHDGERASAAAKADALVKSLGLTWVDVIAPPLVPSPQSNWRSYDPDDWQRMARFCHDRWARLTERELEFVRSMMLRRSEPFAKAERLAALDLCARERRGAAMRHFSPPPPVDFLTQAMERVRDDLDQSIPICQRARNFWAGVVCSWHLAASDVVSSGFQRLADETGLTVDLVKFGGSFNGRETVDHLIHWGLLDRDPFGCAS